MFSYLQSSDASFETAQVLLMKPLQIFYSHNIVTDSIGVIFYHNNTSKHYKDNKDKIEKKLELDYNLIEPCYRMLNNYIDLDRVHKFGNLSPS